MLREVEIKEEYVREACYDLIHPLAPRDCVYAVGEGVGQDAVYDAVWYWEFWDAVDY